MICSQQTSNFVVNTVSVWYRARIFFWRFLSAIIQKQNTSITFLHGCSSNHGIRMCLLNFVVPRMKVRFLFTFFSLNCTLNYELNYFVAYSFSNRLLSIFLIFDPWTTDQTEYLYCLIVWHSKSSSTVRFRWKTASILYRLSNVGNLVQIWRL